MGNGGSAATASHFANDLGKAAKKLGRTPICVFCLTDNVPWLTALANDDGYEDVFTVQLDNHLRPGDVMIVISASGDLTNLVRAVELVNRGVRQRLVSLILTAGFCGKWVNTLLLVSSEIGCYGPVKDVHLTLRHAITDCRLRTFKSSYDCS